MKRIEFSETTIRLRRNLVAASSLIVVIAGFDIKVEKAASTGVVLENLTTNVVIAVLTLGLVITMLRGVDPLEEPQPDGNRPPA